jgi:hypothetical protein
MKVAAHIFFSQLNGRLVSGPGGALHGAGESIDIPETKPYDCRDFSVDGTIPMADVANKHNRQLTAGVSAVNH